MKKSEILGMIAIAAMGATIGTFVATKIDDKPFFDKSNLPVWGFGVLGGSILGILLVKYKII